MNIERVVFEGVRSRIRVALVLLTPGLAACFHSTVHLDSGLKPTGHLVFANRHTMLRSYAADTGMRFMADTGLRVVSGKGDTVRLFSPSFLSVCARAKSETCANPIFTDDQGLMDNSGQPGPHAYVAPADGLKMLRNAAAFTDLTYVGFVWIKPDEIVGGTLPDNYLNLLLNPTRDGVTCMYLRWNGKVFDAYMVAAAAVPCPDKPDVTDSQKLEVRAAPNPPNWASGSEEDQADRIPPVARFHEGNKHGVKGIPLIGIRCGGKWCMLLPRDHDVPATVDTANLAHKGYKKNGKTWEVHGWHDVQHLSEPTTAPRKFTFTNHDASIVATESLGSYDWTVPVPRHAATIHFPNDPTGSYAGLWHYLKGDNDLYVWKDAAGKWQGYIQNEKGPWYHKTTYIISVNVDQVHKGTNPPATARFRWSNQDEDVWVECETGCCYVSLTW